MPDFAAVTPVLRIFDEAKAREFYIDFLGFAVQFEHRFAADLPLYLSVQRGAAVLHLSEHHGDATPGARVRIETRGLDDFWRELDGKAYRHARPGRPERQPWGDDEMTVTDPFGNRLTFFEARS